MKKRRNVVFLTLLCWSRAGVALSTPAYVNANENEGEAFLFNRGNGCYAILPTHVLGEEHYAILTAPPLVDGAPAKSAQGDKCYSWTDVETSIMKVSGLARAECGTVFAAAAPVRELAQPNTIGTLVRTNRNGSITSKRVSVTFVGATRVALIRAVRDEDALRKGDSGATLYLQNLATAMLQDVSPETGEGSVVGFSEISTRLEDAGQACGWAQSAYIPSQVQSLDRSNVWLVSAWSHAPISSEYRPENLLAKDSIDSYWAIDLAGDRKAWIEFTNMNATAALVNTILIELPPAPSIQWPKALEAYTCATESNACVPAMITSTGDSFVVQFGVPREAKKIRIELYAPPKRSTIGLGRIRIK